MSITGPFPLPSAPFFSTPYSATGASALRADKDRWADWLNVKEFGATGNGSTDDTAAFNAMIAAAPTPPFVSGGLSGPQGRFYVPEGTYKTTAPISTARLIDFVMQGDGPGSCIIGNFAGAMGSPTGYIIAGATAGGQKGPSVIRDLNLVNNAQTAGTGAIWMPFGTSIIESCWLKGFNAVNLSNGNDGGAPSSMVRGNLFNCSANNTVAGSWAIAASNSHSLIGNDIAGFDHGIRASNTGVTILGGRFEVNNIGIALGITDWYPNAPGNPGGIFGQNLVGILQSSGTLIAGMSFEQNNTAVQNIGGASAITCGPFTVQGGPSAPAGASIAAIIAGSADHWILQNVVASGGFSGAAIQLPNSDPTFSCFNVFSSSWSGGDAATFIGCNRGSNPVTFANRASSPDVGKTQWFSDSNTAAFRATIAGGGANLVLGLWNGTTWTVAG